MIKNELQHKVALKKLLKIKEGITRLQAENNPLPTSKQLVLASLMDSKDSLEQELAAYEELIVNPLALEKPRSITDLPELIIEYKIASGMTQKEFSEKIGMKQQQLQRYEAEGFTSISFKNLLRILNAIGLNITIHNTRIDEINSQKTGSIA
jgi:HTH-type transcriptional regulator/antitoxin HigA